jgi:hypothetical protein
MSALNVAQFESKVTIPLQWRIEIKNPVMSKGHEFCFFGVEMTLLLSNSLTVRRAAVGVRSTIRVIYSISSTRQSRSGLARLLFAWSECCCGRCVHM